MVQIQTGLPYSATTSGTQTGAVSRPLGAGGAARLPKFDAAGNLETERNIFTQPSTAVFDLRLGKDFNLPEVGTSHLRLEVFAELFNVFNHQNITSVSTGSYTICTKAGTAGVAGGCPSGVSYPTGQGFLVFNSNFGTNNNSNSNTVLYSASVAGRCPPPLLAKRRRQIRDGTLK